MVVSVGRGLSTSRLTPDPLLSVPFSTTTDSWPAVANTLAGTVAVILVGLTYVEVTELPPTCTTELDSKPVPVMVNVRADEPAEVLDGETDATVGDTPGFCVPPPPPEFPPEQPAKGNKRHSKATK
jgi:hypothetical protein